jgi:sulfatase maturation enzyme AslB (radical SAM superfamily)
MKILCFGNNDYDTDHRVSAMANLDGVPNHGLIQDHNFVPEHDGYYHTTTVDTLPGTYVNLGERFDKVILLDQPQDSWTHWKILLTSYKTLKALEKFGVNTEFRNNTNIKGLPFFDELVGSNPSFCIYPWVLMLEERGKFVACPKSKPDLGVAKPINWKDDPKFTQIRNKMLQGEKIPECEQCYYEESRGITSTRQFETMDWVGKLNLKSLEDLEKLKAPSYYEIRFGNTCNLACRMCIPQHSSIIEKEFKELGITYIKNDYNGMYSDVDRVVIEELSSSSRVYFTGGEPTVFPEFYTFMQRCIDAGRTDFDFCLGYNGQKLSNKMIDMFSHFSNMNFSFSIDGYGKINDYIRSYSDWDTIIKNANILKREGHTISLETIPSIYNAANLHLLFEFFDQEFPDSVQFLQIEQQHPGGHLECFSHPDAEACVRSLERVKKTNKYQTDGRGTQSIIDSMYDHYIQNPQPDLEKLRRFFELNDKLDQKRGTRLADYIPELEAGRKFLG